MSDFYIMPVFDGYRFDAWKEAAPEDEDDPREVPEPDFDAIREMTAEDELREREADDAEAALRRVKTTRNED